MLAVAAAAALSLTAATAGATPNPQNTCPGAVKIEDPVDGSYAVTVGAQSGVITLDVDEATNVFSFTTSGDLPLWQSVLVKGGPGAATFAFDPAVSSADGLHAPTNPNNGTYYGLSHVCFYPAPAGGGGGQE